MAVQTFPRPVNPKLKKQTDDQVAKVGQLNQLVRDVNSLNVTGPSPTGIPFDWYPLAGLTTGGTKFIYTDGVELISYHIKGIQSISYSNSSNFSEYLCTVSVQANGGPGIFPGSLTGMFLSGTGNDIVTSPLAVGGLIEINGQHIPLATFSMTLYSYNNPQPDGSYWYALVAEGNTDAAPGNLTGLMSYDFEMLLPNFVPAPTIFQD
jgi:hypothetical protein